MAIKRFPSQHNSEYTLFEAECCNLVNPITHFEKLFTGVSLHVEQMKHLHILKSNTHKERIELNNRLKTIAKMEWKGKLAKILATPISDDLIELLQESKKKKQQKLLKKLSFNSDTFVAASIYAWHKFKMPYSMVVVDHMPHELKGKTFPMFLEKRDNGNFEFDGVTDLTERQMNVAIEKRNRIMSEFVGDEQNWHCFFRTLSGIKGRETPHEGEPHLHYISSAWGLSRDEVIKQLSSYRYNLRAETIPYISNNII